MEYRLDKVSATSVSVSVDCTAEEVSKAFEKAAKVIGKGMMGLTGGCKNMFGAIPGTDKPEYHYRYPNPTDFSRMLVDINA